MRLIDSSSNDFVGDKVLASFTRTSIWDDWVPDHSDADGYPTFLLVQMAEKCSMQDVLRMVARNVPTTIRDANVYVTFRHVKRRLSAVQPKQYQRRICLPVSCHSSMLIEQYRAYNFASFGAETSVTHPSLS
jgi:hypothetical protein